MIGDSGGVVAPAVAMAVAAAAAAAEQRGLKLANLHICTLVHLHTCTRRRTFSLLVCARAIWVTERDHTWKAHSTLDERWASKN